MGVMFKEVNIKCKSSRSLNEVIQQGCSYWCAQLFSFSFYDQCSLIGAWFSCIKSFWSKGKEGHIFLLHVFPGLRFFSDGDRYLATNIVKNVVSLPLWALKIECWLKVFSLVNQNKCKFLILGAVFPTFLLDIVWLPTSLAVEQLLTCSSRTQSGFGAVSWWVV